MKAWVLIVCTALLLAGCGADQGKQEGRKKPFEEQVLGNPTPQMVLQRNPAADIMMYNNIVLIIGSDWVNEIELTKDELLLEISLQTDDAAKFVNGAASDLPVGTKIYKVKERGDILIAETDKGDIRYFKLVEG